MNSDIYRTGIMNRKTSTRPSAISYEQKVSGANRFREQYNPLRGMTLSLAVSLMEQGQRGEFADLQWLYYFVEMTDAIPFTLVDRRISAMMEMDWNIKIVDQDKRAGFDEKLAADQQAFLREEYDRIDNLYEAIEHLEMAAFRSYAHLQPHFNQAGEINHLEILDQWNFVRDGLYGSWYWNPEAKSCGALNLGTEAIIDPKQFIIRTCRRHIDRIALVKFIRKSLGEKDWSAFVEIYGIPGCIVIGPANVPPGKESEYESAAEAVAQGASGYLPNGSQVHVSSGERGVNPFRDFIRYFDEQLVIVGTGGMLTTLAESGSGTLAGGAHSETFRSIARMEARAIGEVLQKQFDQRLLAARFPDKPVLAYFELAFDESPDKGEIIDHSVKLYTAGYQIDIEELSEKTGYTLSKATPGPLPDTEPGNGNPRRGVAPLSLKNRASEALELTYADARMDLAKAQQEALEPLANELLAIYEADLDPAERDAKLKDLQARLPDLLSTIEDRSEVASVMEKMMAAALVNGIAEGAAV